MDTIENWISSLLDKPVRLILPGLALIAVVAVWRMWQSRSLLVIKNEYTYILVNRDGFSEDARPINIPLGPAGNGF